MCVCVLVYVTLSTFSITSLIVLNAKLFYLLFPMACCLLPISCFLWPMCTNSMYSKYRSCSTYSLHGM